MDPNDILKCLKDNDIQQNMIKYNSLVGILEQYIRENGPHSSCARLIDTLEIQANSQAQDLVNEPIPSLSNAEANENPIPTENFDIELPTSRNLLFPSSKKRRAKYMAIFIFVMVLATYIGFLPSWKLKHPFSRKSRDTLNSSCTDNEPLGNGLSSMILTAEHAQWNFCFNLATPKTAVLDGTEIFENEEFLNHVQVRCENHIKVLQISVQITRPQLLRLLNKLECITTLKFVGRYGGIIVEKETAAYAKDTANIGGSKIILETVEFDHISEAFIPGIVVTLEELGSGGQLDYLRHLSDIKFNCVCLDRIISRQIGGIVNAIAANAVDGGENDPVLVTCGASRGVDNCNELKLNEEIVKLKKLSTTCG